MRLGFGVLIGALFIAAGVAIVLQDVFHIHVPLVRTVFAIFLVYLGVRVLFGSWSAPGSPRRGEDTAVFSDSRFQPTETSGALKYNVVFGRGNVDLTKLPRPQQDTYVEVNTVFGGSVIRMDPTLPYEVEASSAFGEARMPNRDVAAFGSVRYRSPAPEGERAKLHVKVNVVFGSAQVVEGSAPEGAYSSRLEAR